MKNIDDIYKFFNQENDPLKSTLYKLINSELKKDYGKQEEIVKEIQLINKNLNNNLIVVSIEK